MDAFTVFLILFFGIGAAIPALWSGIGYLMGNKRFWPGSLGMLWAIGLLVVTFAGIFTNWGGCPTCGCTGAEGSVQCYRKMGDKEAACKPDVWMLECRQADAGCVTTVSPGYCPAGQIAVFPFCERIQRGGVKQPWATWSDLSFVAAGLWLLWFLHFYERSERPGEEEPVADNPMRMIGWLSVIYGMVIIFMGPPSQWYHASMKAWAGWFDSMSVVIWLTFNAVYVIYMLFCTMWDRGRGKMQTRIVLGVWGAIVVICAFFALKPATRTPLYFVGGVPWGIAEFVYLGFSFGSKKVVYRRHAGWFIANVSVLAVTMLIWGFWNDSLIHTSCVGRAGFPGHAVFHIMASFSTVLTFFSFASERKEPPTVLRLG